MKKSFFIFMLTVSFTSYSCESKTFGFNPNTDNTGDLVPEGSNAFLHQTEFLENKTSDELAELCPTHGMNGSYLEKICYSCVMPHIEHSFDKESFDQKDQQEAINSSTDSFVIVNREDADQEKSKK